MPDLQVVVSSRSDLSFLAKYIVNFAKKYGSGKYEGDCISENNGIIRDINAVD